MKPIIIAIDNKNHKYLKLHQTDITEKQLKKIPNFEPDTCISTNNTTVKVNYYIITKKVTESTLLIIENRLINLQFKQIEKEI